MQRLSINLPKREAVDTFLFCRNISHALRALASDPHATLVETLFQSKVMDVRVDDPTMETISALTVEDRVLLREMLGEPPLLTLTSEDSERTRFQELWKQHPKHIEWRPYMPTERDQAAAAFQATFVQGQHLDQSHEWLDREFLQAQIDVLDHCGPYTACRMAPGTGYHVHLMLFLDGADTPLRTATRPIKLANTGGASRGKKDATTTATFTRIGTSGLASG